ncbi:MAG: response regulator transcription factor [Bacteroidales bacterium]|nr:response regulator transcription factor [Bacteroidales bacterium]
MKKPKLLYVEDDVYLSFVTVDNLEQKGYEVVHCKDGKEALQCFRKQGFDLCILDVMLPKLDGFELARKIRETNPEIPILFLTAKSLKEDRITGLSIGGDDYITKPFSIEELTLRIEIFLKRSRINITDTSEVNKMRVGRYLFDRATYTLSDGTGQARLTPMEAELLRFFCNNRNKVLRREEILNAVWGNDTYLSSRSLDVFISRLRKHLRRDEQIRISNVHRMGFIFQVEENERAV